jgi:hypothetical protein
MKRFALVGLLLLAMAGFAVAMQDPSTEEGVTAPAQGFDLNLLWKGAIAGGIATLVRFWSKGKKLKEFDFKYAALYVGVGVIAGVYAAWREMALSDVLSWVEGSGIVMVIWMLLKGGKEAVPKVIPALLAIFTKKKKEGGDAPPDPPPPPSNPS